MLIFKDPKLQFATLYLEKQSNKLHIDAPSNFRVLFISKKAKEHNHVMKCKNACNEQKQGRGNFKIELFTSRYHASESYFLCTMTLQCMACLMND